MAGGGSGRPSPLQPRQVSARKTEEVLMTDLTTRPATTTSETGGATGTRRPGAGDPGGKGRTTIADGVVAKIAAASAREVPGVHGLGTGMTRALGSVRDRVPAG